MDRELHTLIRLLGSEHAEVREYVSQVLANIGAEVVRPLIRKLHDRNPTVRHGAAAVLASIGDSTTLPRIVLVDTRLTPEQRARTLEALRHVAYDDGRTSLRYPLPEIQRYCEQSLEDADPDLAAGAQAVLTALQRDTLLRAADRNLETEPRELLHIPQDALGSDLSQTLLHPLMPNPPETSPRKRGGLWKRLFRRR